MAATVVISSSRLQAIRGVVRMQAAECLHKLAEVCSPRRVPPQAHQREQGEKQARQAQLHELSAKRAAQWPNTLQVRCCSLPASRAANSLLLSTPRKATLPRVHRRRSASCAHEPSKCGWLQRRPHVWRYAPPALLSISFWLSYQLLRDPAGGQGGGRAARR